MAGKPLNRMDLRRQHEAAEPVDPMEDESDDIIDDGDDEETTERKPKKKAKPAAKAKPKATKAAKPAARMRIVWTVMNDAFKAIATFEFAQKEAADTKAAEMTAKGKGTHFVMKSKEPMPDDAPGLGAAIPRSEIIAAVKATKEMVIVEEDDEPEPESDEEEDEPEAEEDSDDD